MFVAIPLAAAVTLFSSSAQGLDNPAVVQNSARSHNDPVQRFKSKDSSEIVSVYELLLSKRRSERVGMFRELPSSMKSALWRHHLTKTIAGHPELSPEQRSIIEDLISILTPALYDLSPQDRQWKTVVQDPLEEIRRRAWVAFPSELIPGIFLDLQFRDGSKTRTATSLGLQPTPTVASYCNCNRNFDDCYFWNGSGSYCSLECYFTKSWGCGPGWVLNCDGYCTPPDPPT